GIEIGVDPVSRHNRSQQALSCTNQIAHGDFGTTDAAIDRRGNTGESKVETGTFQLRCNGRYLSLGFGSRAAAGIGQLSRDRLALAQTLTATSLVDSSRLDGTGLLQLRLKPTHFSLERARVDLEQQITFLHQTALGKADPIDVAGHSWTD